MRVSRRKGLEYAFFILSIINVIVKQKYGIAYISYISYLIILMEVCTKKINCEKFLLYALFIPNKYLQIFTIPIYLFLKGKIFKPKFTKTITIFFILIIFSGIVNCFVYKGLLIATVFQLGFYYCILVLIQQFNDYADERISVEFFDYIFVVQIICALLNILISHGIGDNIKGTFESAHYLGVFLLVYLYMLYKVDNKKKSRMEIIVRYAFGIVIFILADAKHIFLVVMVAACIVWILNKMNIRKQIMIIGVCLLVGMGLFINFAQSDAGHLLIKGHDARTYLYNEKYNKKYTYLVNTYEEMKSINGLIGFGLGQYGSQISITLSKGIIYEWNDELVAYKYAIEPYRRSISGLMTDWYTNIGISNSSMVLGYPLVSFVAMVAEMGVLGFLLFCKILDEAYQEKNKMFIVSFIFLTIFDTYLEIVCVFVLILFVTNIYQKKEKIVIE